MDVIIADVLIGVVCVIMLGVFGIKGVAGIFNGLFENNFEAVYRGRCCMFKGLICASLIYIGYNIFFVKLFGG